MSCHFDLLICKKISIYCQFLRGAAYLTDEVFRFVLTGFWGVNLTGISPLGRTFQVSFTMLENILRCQIILSQLFSRIKIVALVARFQLHVCFHNAQASLNPDLNKTSTWHFGFFTKFSLRIKDLWAFGRCFIIPALNESRMVFHIVKIPSL